MRKLIVSAATLICAAAAQAGMSQVSFIPEHVAVGEAGGSMVLFIGADRILDGVSGNCHEWERTYFYLPLSDERTKHFEAIALTAKTAGSPIRVYFNDGYSKITMQWIGATGCRLENVRIQ